MKNVRQGAIEDHSGGDDPRHQADHRRREERDTYDIPPVGIGMGKPVKWGRRRPAVMSWLADDGWFCSMTSGMTRIVYVGPLPDRRAAVLALRAWRRQSIRGL